MNIFLINHYAGSPKMGMEYRPYYLAKEWVKMGHTVNILVANYSHIRTINPVLKKDIEEENIDGINYIWINTPKYKGNGVGRIKNMYAFINKTWIKAGYFAKTYKPDVVIASSTYPSDNYVAKKIAKLSGAKYIYEVHDLWPLSPMELGGMSKYHPFIVAMQHAENLAYRKADAVVSMLPATQEHMKEHGLDLRKWHYIPNGIVVEDWMNTSPLPLVHQELFEKLQKDKQTIVAYTGGHAISNALFSLVETARILQENTSISFVLIGDGIEKEQIINSAKDLSNMYFLDSIEKAAIPNALKMCDILFIGWNKNPLYRFGISPNKIFDYMMAEKPIIHAVNAPNNFVEEAKCGIAVEAENSDAIAQAILKLQKTGKEEREAMTQSGKKYVLGKHDYKVLAKQFISIFESIKN